MIDIVAFDGSKSGGTSGVAISVVLNYSALPDPTTVPNTYYWAEETEGTKWLPLSVGGTFHNSGLYYSNGTEWQNSKTPFQATLAEVNTGVNQTRFVSPYTFANSTKIVNSFQKNVDDTDDITEGVTNKFVPLYVNDASKYLDSFGAWTVPAGGGGATPLFPPAFLYQTIKVVQTLADFPTPIANEILLVDDVIYEIDSGDLDIEDNTIVFNQRSQLNGFGQNVNKISSSHSGTVGNPHVFFKSEKNLFMNDLEIQCKGTNQLVWQCIADGTTLGGESFEINRFHVICFLAAGHNNQLGYIKDIRQGFVGTFSTIGFENGFILAGAWAGGFRVENTIFITGTGIFFGCDATDPVTFLSRFASNANLTVPTGSIGYDFPETSFTFDGQYQLQGGNVSGSGTYVTDFTSGHPSNDPIGNFRNNSGIKNTFVGVEWISTGDNIVTISTANVWYKVPISAATVREATWVSYANGEVTYNSDNALDGSIITRISAVGKSNDIVEIKIVKEDVLAVQTDLIVAVITIQGSATQGRAENVTIPTTSGVNKDDALSVWLRNTSGTSDVTILEGANFILGQK